MVLPDSNSTPELLWEIFVPIPPARWQVKSAVRGRHATLYSPEKMKRCQEKYVGFLKSAYRGDVIEDPICLMIDIHMQKPKTVKRSYPSVMPDLTNLVKFVEDCVTKADILKDDNLVCMQVNTKTYDDTKYGSNITILKL